MTVPSSIQYIVDEQGTPVSVIVPIAVWREIASEQETAYLLKSDTMRQRLLEAKARQGGIAIEDARAQLDI